MFAFIVYELKVAVILAAFYLCFKLLLSREKLHGLNRVVLLSTAILSFVLPLCIITLHKTVPMPEPAESGIIEDMAPSLETVSYAGDSTFGWKELLIAVYWLGVLAVLSSIVVGVMRVVKLIKSGERRELNGIDVIVCKSNIAPFSWMKWIVLCGEDYQSGNNHILEHEKAHIRLGHSKDVLLVDVLSSFQWFNPAIWLFKRDLRAVHEYEADDAVLRNGADVKEYQYSLIRKALAAGGYSITNSFNHSILKSRIDMMSSPKASTARGLKAIYLLPLLCCALILNARTVFDYPGDGEMAHTEDRESGTINEVNVIAYGGMRGSMTSTTDEEPVDFTKLDKIPGFEGGDANMFSVWVNKRLQYPESAKAAGETGRVVVRFKVNSDGRVSDVSVLRGISSSLDEEAVRVVSLSPDWTPGEKDGKPVATTFTFPVIFSLR